MYTTYEFLSTKGFGHGRGMANPTQRLSSNAPGPFYVDEECIDCDMCRAIAPWIFSLDENVGKSRVQKQPCNAEEFAAAEEALEGCPVGAIGRES
jgi:ferredoxin